MFNLDFYRGKHVFITGHTGFKGSWLCKILSGVGANVTGYSLEAPTKPSLFELAGLEKDVHSVIGDIRDREYLTAVFHQAAPEIVFHLAAQPIVRDSYENPAYTYEVNVIGTVNILECIRQEDTVRSFLNVTTDKVYKNREWEWGYREIDELNGFDPYSNSKSCSELVTHSYRESFLDEKRIAVSTARAGNVIGGGDFSKDRIIPDCVRAVSKGKEIIVRNPYSTRPYEHVLEPLYVYLMIAGTQYQDRKYAGCYNIGPGEEGYCQTGDLVDLFCQCWGEEARWIHQPDRGPHEANLLKLDCSKLRNTFGWHPRWGIESAVRKTVEWNKCWLRGENIKNCMDRQIEAFLNSEDEAVIV